MGLHTYVPLPGPFSFRGGTITTLLAMMLYMCWWMLVIMIYAAIAVCIALVLASTFTAQRISLAKQHRAAKRELAVSNPRQA